MMVKHPSAIRNGEEEGFAKVKTGVPSDRQPKIPGSLQPKSKNQSGDSDVGCSNDSFARIPQVICAKQKRETHGSRPESHASRQSVLHISTKQEFLGQPHQHESHCPIQSPSPKARPVNVQLSEGVSAERRYQTDKQTHLAQPKKNALPEGFPKSVAQRQAIKGGLTPLQASHEKRRCIGGGKANKFLQSHRAWRPKAAAKSRCEYDNDRQRVLNHQQERAIEKQTPARAQALWANKNRARQPFGRLGWEGGSRRRLQRRFSH